jgi:hypothetical protein
VYTDETKVRGLHVCGAVIAVSLAALVVASGEQPSAAVVSTQDISAKPVGANWPTYNGDYTGRRFTAL